MIVFDTNALILKIDPASSEMPPADRAAERIEHFVKSFPANGEIGLPAPVVAEFVSASNHDER